MDSSSPQSFSSPCRLPMTDASWKPHGTGVSSQRRRPACRSSTARWSPSLCVRQPARGDLVLQSLSSRVRTVACVACVTCGALTPSQALAQTGTNVLLVINERDTASIQVGEYYARRRAVPSDNVVRIAIDSEDAVERPVFERDIEGPISAAIARQGAQDRIL